jgi:hypothetical protein
MPSFGERWDNAGQQVEIPAGNYDVEVIDAEGKERKSDGCEYIKLVFYVQRGPYQGQTWDSIFMLDKDMGLERAKDTLGMLGLSIQTPGWTELREAVRGLAGVTANVTRTFNDGGYAELKINTSQLPITDQQPAAASPPPPPAAPVTAGGRDDIPF